MKQKVYDKVLKRCFAIEKELHKITDILKKEIEPSNSSKASEVKK